MNSFNAKASFQSGGTDYTIYALIDGTVKFEHHSKSRFKVSVYPATEATSAA